MFGWTKAEAINRGPMGTYQLFATGGMAVGGMMTKPETIPMPLLIIKQEDDVADRTVP
jgi:uncharacterized protein